MAIVPQWGDPRLPPRFWNKVVPEPMGGCWLFLTTTTAGYGSVFDSETKKIVYAHRLAYERLVGPIADGLHIDHRCRVRCCCNPSHLEQVTNAENMRRGLKGVLNTHCPYGHAYTEKNTYITKTGSKICKACVNIRTNIIYHRKRGHIV